MKAWRVRRIVEELYEIEAETKDEAWEKVADPHSIRIIRETIRLVKILEDAEPAGEAREEEA